MRHIPSCQSLIILTLLFGFAWRTDNLLYPGLLVAAASHPRVAAASSRLVSDYGKLPVSFEANMGQSDKSVQFLAHGSGYMLYLAPGEAVLSLHSELPAEKRDPAPALRSTIPASARQSTIKSTAATIAFDFIAADLSAPAEGMDPLPGKSNYFIGSDPAAWHTDVPTYAKVRYHGIYPGIDLTYYGNHEGRIEHDFLLSPGANPDSIGIAVRGANAVLLQQDRRVLVRTNAGDLALEAPLVYQTIAGQRRTVDASYRLDGATLKFRIGQYDKQAPLVIDPVLAFTAVWGGTYGGLAWGMAIDPSGNSYVTGYTWSTDFPIVNAVQGSWPGGNTTVFVSKINAAGTALLYSTYLGQNNGGCADSGIAVDALGKAYVVGGSGPGIPLKNAYQSTALGCTAFLTVFAPAGNSLVYSTYFGPPNGGASAAAVDASGNAYIAGTVGTDPGGGVFVAKFDSLGSLQYSRFFGSGTSSGATALAVDSSGSAYVTGWTFSSTFPVTLNAFQRTCRACPNRSNAFITKLSPSGTNLTYSTYLGGTQGSSAFGIALDSSDNAYVAGSTGYGFPTISNALQRSFRGGSQDGFVSKLNSSGTGLIWSTYLGGWADDFITGIALDQYRNVYVAGETNSPNFPLKASLQPSRGSGRYQKFVTTLSGSLGSIVYYSTLLGTGSTSARSIKVAVDKSLNLYLASSTDRDMLPTQGALARYPSQWNVNLVASKLVIMDDMEMTISASPSLSVGSGGNLTYTLAATSNGPDFGYNVRIDDPLPAGTTFVSFASDRGACTAPPVGSTGTLHCTLQQLEKGDTFTVTLTVMVHAAAGSTLTNAATATSNMQDFTPANNKAVYTSKVN